MFSAKQLIIWFLSLTIAGVIVGCGSPDDGERIRARGDKLAGKGAPDGDKDTKPGDDPLSTTPAGDTSKSTKIVSLNTLDKSVLDEIKNKPAINEDDQALYPKDEEMESTLNKYTTGSTIPAQDLKEGTYTLSRIFIKGSTKIETEENYKSLLQMDIAAENDVYSASAVKFWATELDFPAKDGVLLSTKISMKMDVSKETAITDGQALLANLIRSKKKVSYALINLTKDKTVNVRSALEIAESGGSLTESVNGASVQHIVLLYPLENDQLSIHYSVIGSNPMTEFILIYDYKAKDEAPPADPDETAPNAEELPPQGDETQNDETGDELETRASE